MTKKLLFSLLTVLLIFSYQSTEAQIFKKKKKKTEAPSDKKDKDKIKPYDKVITKEAVTDNGLFDVHVVDDKHYYEIPDSLFNREMLMVSRISKTASKIGFGGGKINTQVLRWEKKDKKVLLRVVSHDVVAADSLPVHEAVVNSNFEPVLYAFEIKAFKKDSLHPATVIEVDDIFTKDTKAFGMPDRYRKRYKISRLDTDRSFIENIRSYPMNVEARHVKTYLASAPPSNGSLGSISVEINNSMVLLPKEPMKRRYFDRRVGWFARGQVDYGLDAQESKTLTFLDRWRLEVKDEDIEKYKKGELVEPKKTDCILCRSCNPKTMGAFHKKRH